MLRHQIARNELNFMLNEMARSSEAMPERCATAITDHLLQLDPEKYDERLRSWIYGFFDHFFGIPFGGITADDVIEHVRRFPGGPWDAACEALIGIKELADELLLSEATSRRAA
jgi:hypothetical protein